MPTEPTPRTTSNWREAFPWLLLAKIPAIALRGRVMLLAAMGVLAIWSGEQLFHDDVVNQRAVRGVVAGEVASASWQHVSGAWIAIADPFVALANGEKLVANTFRCLLRIAMWGLIGGAIMRVAALALTRDEAPDVTRALRYAWRNRAGFVGGPLLLMAGLAIVAAPLGVVRLAMQVSWLAPIGAILWPLLLVGGVMMAIYAIGMAIGWPLTGAAVATEQSDGFDAISRMFAYIYQKPLRLAGYVAVAIGLGLLTGAAVQVFVAVVLYISSVGLGNTTSLWAASLVAWWESFFVALASVYFTAYLWTSATAIYLLLRQDIDGVHLDEVFIDPAEQIGGLPELKTGPIGVPEVVRNDQNELAA